MTGMRSCSSAASEFGGPVMIVKLSIGSGPFFQRSHRPAIANSEPSRMPMGRLRSSAAADCALPPPISSSESLRILAAALAHLGKLEEARHEAELFMIG